MTGILLTQSQTPIIGQIAWLLGKVMDWIYIFLSSIGMKNISITIIVFTIVVYMLMLPMTIKQQKTMKLNAIIMPEVQQIQKKYKNKKDQASMLKQQEEIKAVYEKYGTSQLGGCSQLLIQMPLLFGFFQVIRNVPAYVPSIKMEYESLVNGIMGTNGFQEKMAEIAKAFNTGVNPEKFEFNTIVDVLYKLPEKGWNELLEVFPDNIDALIHSTRDKLTDIMEFLHVNGTNISETPWDVIRTGSVILIIIAIAVPLLSGLTQYISVKLQPQAGAQAASGGEDNQMMNSMNSMTKVMPIMSIFFCFTMPLGLGLYWIISAVVRTVQQLIINRYFQNVSLDEMIEKNKEKAAKKREKKGTSSSKLNEMAQRNARSIAEAKQSTLTDEEKNKKMETATKMNENAKTGSLAARANLVKKYNDGDSK